MRVEMYTAAAAVRAGLLRFFMAARPWRCGLAAALIALAPMTGRTQSIWTFLGLTPYSVNSYPLQSKTLVSGSGDTAVYEYVYKVVVYNSGAQKVDFIAKAVSKRSNATIIDGNLSFGTLPANGTKLSNDTIVIRSGPYFDRRPDRKVNGLLGQYFAESGHDPEDFRAGIWIGWFDISESSLNNWYKTKLNSVIDWSVQVRGDTVAPVISGKAPTGGVTAARPVITANYSDALAGVDSAQTLLTLDSVAVTDATATTTSVTYTPLQALTQGAHTATVKVVDLAGNSSSSTWSFTVDTIAPVISATQPEAGTLRSSQPVISAALADTGSGVNAPATVLKLDGVDVSAQALRSATGVSFTPAAPLSEGPHTVDLQVTDVAGNAVSSSWTFQVDAKGPAVTAILPAEGVALAADVVPVIRAQFADAVSGILVTSLRVQLDAVDITSKVAATPQGFDYTPAAALTEGPHVLSITVQDNAGNATTVTSRFTTATAPVISQRRPIETVLEGGARPEISAAYADVGSGVDLTKVKLSLNGTDVSGQAQITDTAIRYIVPEALADSTHSVVLSVTDKAGNVTTSSWQFATAQPPQIVNPSPKDVVLPSGARPTITAFVQDSRVGLSQSGVRLLFNGLDVSAQATVSNGAVSFTPAQALQAGPYTVYLEVSNQTNGTATMVWGFEVANAPTYSLTVMAPSSGATVLDRNITLQVEASSNVSAPREVMVGTAQLRLQSASETGSATYSGDVELVDGLNTIQSVVTFVDGTTRSTSTQITYDAPPTVAILSPLDKAVFGPVDPTGTAPGGAVDLTGNVERPLTITGRTSKPVVSVMLNQQKANLDVDGMSFSFPRFFLHEGVNLINAVSLDSKGRTASTAIYVGVDQTAPILNVEFPQDGLVTRATTIELRGMVNDAVEAPFGAPEPQVWVNDRQAQVGDRYFQLSAYPLVLGQNVLTIKAIDQLGNTRTRTLTVQRMDTGLAGVIVDDGQDQTGQVDTELAKPLRVIALDADGMPAVDQDVVFRVDRGTGALSSTQGKTASGNPNYSSRVVSVKTDSQGRAQAWFTVGRHAGPGANVVSSLAPALGGESALFIARSVKGDVAKLSADMGINQIAETGTEPLELLSAVVRDAVNNYLPQVSVRFKVEEGQAHFSDAPNATVSTDRQSIVVVTDKNGVAAVRPTMGAQSGLVRISATALKRASSDFNVADGIVSGADYAIQVRAAKDGPASFSGVLYTDKGEPLPGVRVSIGRTALASTSDADGRFSFSDVPPGRIDLFIDGRTASYRDTQWPSLHFESFVVRGQSNQLAHPIYLPPLLMGEARQVGGDQDVVIEIPGLEGFKMTVKANSVTFPNGAKTGQLVVSPVTADKLPMAPPAGGARFGVPAWTVQPAGARFDPPIQVQMPNSTAELPGDNLPVVQWDHDLGQFVPMGRATVSSDGAFLITDEGSGITKAGWGGLCRYDECKVAVKACAECKKIEFKGTPPCPSCVTDTAKEGKQCGSGKCKRCLAGTCKPDPSLDGNESLGSVGGSLSLDGQAKPRLQIPFTAIGAFMETSGSLTFQYTGEELCCSKTASGTAAKVSGSGSGQYKVFSAFPLLPVLKKASSFIFGSWPSGPSITLEIAFAGSAGGEYDACPNEGSGTGGFSGTAELAFSALGEQTMVDFADGSSKKAEFRLANIGIAGEARIDVKDWVNKQLLLQASGKVDGFFKSSVTIGTLGWTAIDIRAPILSWSPVQFSVPVPGL